MKEPSYETCGSTNGSALTCGGFACDREECGEVTGFSCYDCGHHTSFYHITALGEAVLKELLVPQSLEGITNSRGSDKRRTEK